MDKLDTLRKKIDMLDGKLLELIRERLIVVEEVGKLKKELGLKPLDPTRWQVVLNQALLRADSLHMRRDFVKKILDTIHEEALQIEDNIQ